MAEGAMSAFLTPLSEFFTWSVGNLGDVVSTIVESPVLLAMTAGTLLVGFCFGLVGRLIKL